MFRKIAVSAAVIIVVAAGVAAANQLVRSWPITWDQQSLDFGVPPGEKFKVVVSGTATRSIPPSRVVLSPGFHRYVLSVEPKQLPALSAGSTINVELIVRVATGTPHINATGTLAIHGLAQNTPQSVALPLTLVVGPVRYPPDPGEAGKITLAGIDSDGDGVRDDIQRYIALTYPTQPEVRAGLTQFSIPLQRALLGAGSETVALEKVEVMHRASACLKKVMGRSPGVRAAEELIAEALNTEGRSRAYILYDSQLSGHTFRLRPTGEPIEAVCDFAAQGGAR